ncbi:hypothetical protein [Spirosoma endophyticum]|uniref:Uncharacterized protein n=1 Tax=Spirosoma endophyticum TaxID=662367 RepID=A0A1I2HK29_9BACT|nr:hypothetical protein [Spirosoma endophyticum]SFF30675.1 hypothetical protein SAMN05216167_14511 [Spirosoma endophyticum]
MKLGLGYDLSGSRAYYTRKREQLIPFGKGANGQQSGGPSKLTKALVTIAAEEKTPLRFLAGADAVATAE